MTEPKQSAHSRREDRRIRNLILESTSGLNSGLTNLQNTVSSNYSSLNNTLINVSNQTNSNTTTLNYHWDSSNPDGWEARIQDLELNGGGGGGGGGIDPTDPSVRIVYEDFLYLSNGDLTGEVVFPYSTGLMGGQLTSGLILNSQGNLQFQAADNETGHPGVIKLVYEDAASPFALEWIPAYFGVSPDANVLKWEDVSRITIILKSPFYSIDDPENEGNINAFLFGLSEDFLDPENSDGIYFKSDLTNWYAVTRSGGNVSSVNILPYTSNTWYRLDLKRTILGTVEFYINDTLEHTATTNITTSDLNLGLALESSLVEINPSTVRATSLIDFIGVKLGDPESGGILPTGTTVVGTANEVEVTYDGGTQVYTVGLPNTVIVDQVTVDQLNLDTTLTPANPLADGVIAYDPEYQSPIMGLDGGTSNTNINAPLGSALVKLVRNNTGATITKGQVVYITGSHASTHILVDLADASTEATAKDTIGVAAHNIANNSEGWIITQGYLKGFDTNTTTGTGTEGDTLWLSTTAGAFTYDRPTAPDHGVVVGFMVKSAGGGAGSIYVKVSNGQELEELHDVKITSITNNNILKWDSTDSRWENVDGSKLFDLPQTRLVGRWASAGNGVLQEVTIGSGIKLSNTGILSTDGITFETRLLNAGTGLTGGGDLSTDRTLSVDFATSGTSSSTQAVRADDSRLSDARTPTAHTHVLADITDRYTELVKPTNPVILVDDFFSNTLTTGLIGELGWRFTNGSVAEIAAADGHPGIIRRTSAATTGNVASTYVGSAVTSALFRWDQFEECTFIIDMDSLASNYTARVGITNQAGTSPPGIGCYFEGVVTGGAGNWVPIVKNGANQNSTANAWAVSTNWAKMKIRRISNTQVGFTFNNNSEVTETLGSPNNIPDSTGMQWFLQLTPAANTARSIDIDFFSGIIKAQTR